MPELPEVETVLRTLENQIQDACITEVKVRYAKMVENDVGEFENRLQGEHFRRFERRGKYLIFRMDHCTLVVHLRMEGKFFLESREDPLNRHIHVIMNLSDGRQLRYMDTRKFGRMQILSALPIFTMLQRSVTFLLKHCCWIRNSWPVSGISTQMKSCLLHTCAQAEAAGESRKKTQNRFRKKQSGFCMKQSVREERPYVRIHHLLA